MRAAIVQRVGQEVPSFAVSVVHRGAILWEEAFGWADRGAGVQATANTAYPIASVAKSLTATGLLVLADQGKLDLDRPLDQVLDPKLVSPLAGPLADASVRDMMLMRAGFAMGFKGVFAPNPSPDRDALIRHHGGLVVFPPGKVFHYSNFSLGVAEVAVEQAVGESFGEAMKEAVLGPLGMADTFYSGYGRRTKPPARTYRDDGTPYPDAISLPAGGAGAYASVSDLRRYALAHLGHSPVISEAVRTAIGSTIAEGSGGGFGLGWGRRDLPGDRLVLVSDGHGMGSMSMVQIGGEEQT